MLDVNALRVKDVKEQIQRRFALRGSQKTLNIKDQARVACLVEDISSANIDYNSAITVFLDHVFPVSDKFIPVSQLYAKWKLFKEEKLPMLAHLFPITKQDKTVMGKLMNDLDDLKKNNRFYDHVFCASQKEVIKMFKLYAGSPDYYRILEVLKYYQTPEKEMEYPLFTLRAYLASQIETLRGYLDRLIVGNIVSEKAKERFDKWYDKRFYSEELLAKARKRGTANNPVVNTDIRVEFENQRRALGVDIGDMTKSGEEPVAVATRPKIYENSLKVPTSKSVIAVPAHMRGDG